MTKIFVWIDDAANGVCVQVWQGEDITEQRVFETTAKGSDNQRAERNVNRACDFAAKLSKKYGVEWETN